MLPSRHFLKPITKFCSKNFCVVLSISLKLTSIICSNIYLEPHNFFLIQLILPFYHFIHVQHSFLSLVFYSYCSLNLACLFTLPLSQLYSFLYLLTFHLSLKAKNYYNFPWNIQQYTEFKIFFSPLCFLSLFYGKLFILGIEKYSYFLKTQVWNFCWLHNPFT